MISSASFQDSDLQVEIMALNIPVVDYWACNAFVFYQNETYHLNDPFIFDCIMGQTGEVTSDGTRTFSATLFSLGYLHLDITCSAPTSAFVMLDPQGDTFIHTTVLGTCVVSDVHNGLTLKTIGANALLERKATD